MFQFGYDSYAIGREYRTEFDYDGDAFPDIGEDTFWLGDETRDDANDEDGAIDGTVSFKTCQATSVEVEFIYDVDNDTPDNKIKIWVNDPNGDGDPDYELDLGTAAPGGQVQTQVIAVPGTNPCGDHIRIQGLQGPNGSDLLRQTIVASIIAVE